MNLVFPFKNVTINTFLDFFEEGKVKDFIDIRNEKEAWKNEYFNQSVQMWKDRLPNFENEILQIINTTGQETIDTYFNGLAGNLEYIKECLTKQYFLEKIYAWNTDTYKKYCETIEKETEEFTKHENRKMQHLEEYETHEFNKNALLRLNFSNENKTKVKRINYNYYCIEKIPELIDEDIIDEYLKVLNSLYKELNEISKKYGIPWEEGKLRSKVEQQFIPKPVIFVEGEHDIIYLKTAAKLLNKEEFLNEIEIRQRGGYKNLDKLWDVLKEESWETVPQIKIFLYDCDTNKPNEDFGHHFRRVIPSQNNAIIKKGIENLFPDIIINKAIDVKRAFIDSKKITGIKRGKNYEETQLEINKDEKTNLCHWICSNSKAVDFLNFNIVFEIIENLIATTTNST